MIDVSKTVVASTAHDRRIDALAYDVMMALLRAIEQQADRAELNWLDSDRIGTLDALTRALASVNATIAIVREH